MKTASVRFAHAFATLAGALFFTSCSSPSTTSPPLLLQPMTESWVSPDLKGKPLAFIGNAGNSDIFSLPDFKLKGTVTGLGPPMCSDQSNVWVAGPSSEQVTELSRAGKVLATINDAYGAPAGCAVDLKAGDIAVTNLFNSSGAGAVYVYSCPSCTPKAFTIPSQYYYYFDGYDPKGDLFVDGKTSNGTFVLGEVPAGDTTGQVITISGGTIYFAGMVQWYKPGGYVAVGDQLCGDTEAACVYSIQISGSQGTITGKTSLLNPKGGEVCDMVQGEIDPVAAKYLVGTDYEYCGTTPSSADYWPYPAGGKPTHFRTKGISEPGGVAISIK
jgi:hypothetical protein